MKFWRFLRRLFGFPGLDYIIEFDETRVLEVSIYQSRSIRLDVVEWLNTNVGLNNWVCEIKEFEYVPELRSFDSTLGPNPCRFKFRHLNHAVAFKLVWK